MKGCITSHPPQACGYTTKVGSHLQRVFTIPETKSSTELSTAGLTLKAVRVAGLMNEQMRLVRSETVANYLPHEQTTFFTLNAGGGGQLVEVRPEIDEAASRSGEKGTEVTMAAGGVGHFLFGRRQRSTLIILLVNHCDFAFTSQ